MFPSRPWTSTTGSGWAALGLQDQSLAPASGVPGARIPAVMPETGAGEWEPLDAAAVALEQTSSRATTTNSRPTDGAVTRIVRRDLPRGLLPPTFSSEPEGIRILASNPVAQA